MQTLLLPAFAAIKDQVKGKLSFSADVSLKGATYEQQMSSLKGKAAFKVEDGQLGSIGRIETFCRRTICCRKNSFSRKSAL